MQTVSHIISRMCSIHPTVSFFPQGKSQSVRNGPQGLQNVSALQSLLSPASPSLVGSAPATLASLLVLSQAGRSGLRAFLLLFPLLGKLLSRYFLGPLPHFIFSVNVILVWLRQASPLFCLIFLHCIFNHVKYFFICLLYVFLQVKYMLLKGREGMLLYFTATSHAKMLRVLLSKYSSCCPLEKQTFAYTVSICQWETTFWYHGILFTSIITIWPPMWDSILFNL